MSTFHKDQEASSTMVESTPAFLGMHPDVAAIWVSIGIAFAQLLVAGYWLWRWKKDNDERYRQLAQEDRKHDAKNRKTDQLVEALRLETQALRAVLEGTAPPSPKGSEV